MLNLMEKCKHFLCGTPDFVGLGGGTISSCFHKAHYSFIDNSLSNIFSILNLNLSLMPKSTE